MRRTQLFARFIVRTMATTAMAFTLVASCRAASQEIILHSFQPGGDGIGPQSAGVIADAQSNLYGVTMAGGANGLGAVYELSLQQNGTWSENVIYSFLNDGKDGYFPVAKLVLDTQGNLYGVTTQGGGLRTVERSTS
jgi:uncharacterized repeat protein (TIGR03803 family)